MRVRAVHTAVAIAMCGLGCSTTHYRESADRQVYQIVEEKTPSVPNMVEEFTIDVLPPPELDALPVNEEYVEALGEDAAEAERGARVLSLEQALYMAFNYSRTYQNQKEALYLQALGLTLDRHQFTPIFSGSINADYARTNTDIVGPNELGTFLSASPQVAAALEALTGTPADLFNQFADAVGAAAVLVDADTTELEIMNERSVAANTNLGMDLLLKTGGRIALNLTSNFLRFLTGDPREVASSALIGSFTQPLLRGAGKDVATEFLTQSEHDVLYALREFTDFRRQFSVDVARTYYQVLNSRDQVQNTFRGLESARFSLDRYEALAEEGREPEGERARVEQQALNVESDWIGSIRQYRTALDNFKILIGLSTDAAIILDESELDRLEVVLVEINQEDATTIAMTTRLDLYTTRDQVGDSERRVKVAANALLPGLDIVADGVIDSQDPNRPLSPDWDRAAWSAGLAVDLPFDRKAERNGYRSALIAYERSQRELTLLEDQIKLQVRDALRELEQQRRDVEIRKLGVNLSQRRVEEQTLLAEIGRGNTNDLVDAQNELIAQENGYTSAIVAYTIARLEFFRDLGILYIKDNGQWEEIRDDSGPKTEEGIRDEQPALAGLGGAGGAGGGDLRLSPQ